MNGLMKEMEHLRHARAADSERHRQELEWAEDQRATMSAQMASLSTDLETVRTEARVARTRHEQLVEELTAAQERDVRVITAERDHAQQQLADHVRRYDELAASLAMTNEHSKLLKAQYESTLAQAEHQQQTLAQRLDDKDAMLVDARERMLADHRAATVLSADLKQKLAQLGADRDNLTTQLKAASQASLPVSAGSATRDVASREPPAVPLSPLPLRSAPVHSMATQSMAVQTDGIPTALPPPFAPSPSLEAQRQEQLIAIQALQRQHEALSHAIRQAETHLERTTRRNEQQRAEHAETALLLDETAQSVRQLEHAADLARDAERGAMDAYRRIRIEHDHLHDAVEHLQTMLESRQQTVDQLTAQVAAIRGDVTTATASLDQVRVEAAAARAATREASDDLAATRVRITQVRADLADAEAALQQVRKATEAEKAATERAAAQDRALAALTTPSPAHPAAPLGDAATSSSASSKSPSLAATSPSVPAPSSAPLPASTLVRSQPDRAHTASHAATMELEQTIKGLQNQLAVAESKAAALQRAHDRAVAAMATSAATASLSMPSPQPKRPRSLVARSAVPARPSSAAGIGLHHHASDDGSATAVPAPSLSARATYVLDNHGRNVSALSRHCGYGFATGQSGDPGHGDRCTAIDGRRLVTRRADTYALALSHDAGDDGFAAHTAGVDADHIDDTNNGITDGVKRGSRDC
ncbi:hypothetical protein CAUPRSCDRAFT_11895 [Caulochytrium protostelioides]|uniref:Uncharacterized protein n=1 Tax=Caulochytrium protostelioides TaxID=1555241 RepID=A0A4P9WVR9_9FUNG|nr:hypothetical protein CAUPRSCDRAFT_11895 [Caulochytrium protostelioides]